jgi:hypothetical protein
MRDFKVFAGFALLVVLSSLTPTVYAQKDDGPQFTAAPYLVLPWVAGNMTIRGNDLDVDGGAGEILSNLDFAIMGYFQVRKGSWAFQFDGFYVDLGADATRETPVATAGAALDLKQGMAEFTGARQIAPWADLVFGLRINNVNGSFETQLLPIAEEQSKTWVDPVVGVKLVAPDTGRWLVALRADVGGFGAGSDFAWQIYPTVGYSFADWFSLVGGYRVLSMDYETGSDDNRFGYDLTIQGPFVGASFQF